MSKDTPEIKYEKEIMRGMESTNTDEMGTAVKTKIKVYERMYSPAAEFKLQAYKKCQRRNENGERLQLNLKKNKLVKRSRLLIITDNVIKKGREY